MTIYRLKQQYLKKIEKNAKRHELLCIKLSSNKLDLKDLEVHKLKEEIRVCSLKITMHSKYVRDLSKVTSV